MLSTKFRFIWPSGFRGEDLKKSTNQKQELPMAAMFVNGSQLNEQSLQRTFQGSFLPNFDSFGQAVSEEKIFQKSTDQKQELPVAAMYVTELELQIPPSVSTIKHSGRTESFVGLHTDKCPTKLSDQCPTKSSQVGVRVSTPRQLNCKQETSPNSANQ